MDCHESLMQRRRKKKATAANKRPGGPGVKLDKSLPSLPPNFEDTRSLEETPSEGYVEAGADMMPGKDADGAQSEASLSRPTTAQGKNSAACFPYGSRSLIQSLQII